METLLGLIGAWAGILFFVVTGFLVLGINFLPSGRSGRAALAAFGAVLLVGGLRTI